MFNFNKHKFIFGINKKLPYRKTAVNCSFILRQVRVC